VAFKEKELFQNKRLVEWQEKEMFQCLFEKANRDIQQKELPRMIIQTLIKTNIPKNNWFRY
jgi:hypothetical protein